MIRVIIKGKQGAGKTKLANNIAEMLTKEGICFSIQDGEETRVHKPMSQNPAPVTIAIIVKQG